jgi:hypothetical protein
MRLDDRDVRADRSFCVRVLLGHGSLSPREG